MRRAALAYLAGRACRTSSVVMSTSRSGYGIVLDEVEDVLAVLADGGEFVAVPRESFVSQQPGHGKKLPPQHKRHILI